NPNGVVYGVTVQPDGKVLLGGGFTTLRPNGAASPTPRNYIARVNADGTLDAGFNPKASDAVISMVLQPDGKALLGGYFTSLQPNGAASATPRNGLARINADGTLDAGFNPNPDGPAFCLAL